MVCEGAPSRPMALVNDSVISLRVLMSCEKRNDVAFPMSVSTAMGLPCRYAPAKARCQASVNIPQIPPLSRQRNNPVPGLVLIHSAFRHRDPA